MSSPLVIDERTIRVPLVFYRVAEVEQTLVRAELRVEVRTASRRFKEVYFVVDSASSMSTVSAARAREWEVTVPRKTIEVSLDTATGPARRVRHPGRIQVKILGLDRWQFDWPCHFVEHQGPAPKNALGLSGVLDDLLIILDGSYSFESPYGWLILKRQE